MAWLGSSVRMHYMPHATYIYCNFERLTLSIHNNQNFSSGSRDCLIMLLSDLRPTTIYSFREEHVLTNLIFNEFRIQTAFVIHLETLLAMYVLFIKAQKMLYISYALMFNILWNKRILIFILQYTAKTVLLKYLKI